MKAILLVCAFLIFSGAQYLVSAFSPFLSHYPPPPTGFRRAASDAILKNFTQKLDHFDSEDTTNWTQRYYENREFFDETNNNVVFLQLGGEGPIHENYVLYGSWITSAQKYGALLFMLEHRFYGESQPFADLSTEHLSYLTSDQALADAANFIQTINKEYSLADDVKWIVYGGSYSGALSAWMRLKHPDLVQGSVASSAPLNAKLDFTEYYQVVVDDLTATNKTCVDSLKTAVSQVEEILSDPSATETVSSILNVCQPIEGLDSDDVYVKSFYNRLAGVFSGVAQVNGLQAPSVSDLCNILDDESRGKEIYRLADVLTLTRGSSCLGNTYWYNVEAWQNIYIFAGARQWMYQTCNEFGWFQPSVREDKVFGNGCPLDFLVNMCSDVFGSEFSKSYISDKIKQTNTKYGGTDIDVTNVVFIQGSFDPWHPLGITETKNPDAPAIFVEGTAHCADLSDVAGELPALTEAKKEVDRLIGVWLGLV